MQVHRWHMPGDGPAWTYAYRWRTSSGEPIDGGGGRPAEERSVLALRRGSRGGLRAIYGRARGQDGQANRPASSAAVDHAPAFGGSSIRGRNKRYRLRGPRVAGVSIFNKLLI